MSRIKILIALLFLGFQGFSMTSDTIGSQVWAGKLPIGGTQLTIVVNIYTLQHDSLAATLDSPDQGAKGIAISEIRLTKDSLMFKSKIIGASYAGGFNKTKDTVTGMFKQSGFNLPLTFSLQSGEYKVNRPQEPVPPFPYRSEEVTIHNHKDNVDLAGTLTLPPDPGTYPAVVLITGSGPQNRNEELLGHKPFLVLSDYLTRRGIAVLRYDDRGTGKSTGKFDSATTYDFASDAAAAVSFLQYRDEIDPRRVGAIGHSEGGLIVEILGASPDAPAFLVSMAGPSLTGEEILILQTALISKANGEKESDIEANEKLERDIYSIIKKNNDDVKATYKIKQTLTAFNNRMKGTEGYEPLDSTVMNARIQTLISPWFRTFLTLDPIEYIRKIKCPVLVINGSLDLQVPADENLAGWEKGLIFAGNSKYSIEKVEGVNHLFQHAQTGSPNEYSNIEETISPEVLTIIGNWILQTTGKK